MRLAPIPTADLAPRVHLSSRQAETVAGLLDAAESELRRAGGDSLTLRSVAATAGVTHTTVYRYFSSKEHLVAEMLRRRLCSLPDPSPLPTDGFEARVRHAVQEPCLMLRDQPALAHAALAALVTSDPEVVRLRGQVGDELRRRIAVALGEHGDDATSNALMLCLTGALFQAGMGYFDFAELVDNVLRTVQVLRS